MQTPETMRFPRESAGRRVRVPDALGLRMTREGESIEDVPLFIHTTTKASQAKLAYELKNRPAPKAEPDGEA